MTDKLNKFNTAIHSHIEKELNKYRIKHDKAIERKDDISENMYYGIIVALEEIEADLEMIFEQI